MAARKSYTRKLRRAKPTITSSAAELSDAIADAYFQHANRIRTGGTFLAGG